MTRKALIVWGGWSGHEPQQCAEIVAKALTDSDFDVEVRDTLDAYLDADLMSTLNLIVPVWTMGEITNEQEKALLDAVKGGVGIAGWHGGMGDSFRMRTGYLLASYGRDPWRYSLRVEAFDIEDLDRSSAEVNDESGHALTLAAMRQVGDWRLGLEFLHIDGDRPAAAEQGLPLQAGGEQLRFEARYLF